MVIEERCRFAAAILPAGRSVPNTNPKRERGTSRIGDFPRSPSPTGPLT